MKPKVIVVGSSNTDMVVKVPHIPVPGETIMGSNFMIIPGGKGANQAVAAARAGADVTFVACVSDDTFGKQAIENYQKEGIDTSFIKVIRETHSGIALINVATDGENSISVAPGANSYLLPEDIGACREVFSRASVILAQLEIPIETVKAAADMADSNGIPFILNPAPGGFIHEDLISKISIITPNETEAAILTSNKKFIEEEIPEISRNLYQKGPEIVIITLGSKGVWLKTNETEKIIPGYKVHAVDTTAAGDVFNGALASALANKDSIEDSIDFAQRAAAISVTKMGAQPSAPSLNEIRAFSN